MNIKESECNKLQQTHEIKLENCDNSKNLEGGLEGSWEEGLHKA